MDILDEAKSCFSQFCKLALDVLYFAYTATMAAAGIVRFVNYGWCQAWKSCRNLQAVRDFIHSYMNTCF
jgi:hypothetical protein